MTFNCFCGAFFVKVCGYNCPECQLMFLDYLCFVFLCLFSNWLIQRPFGSWF
jgi:hypothetical protein